jgi:hypothetical protein
MKWMQVSRTSDKGFTILEMMVGIAMTLTVSSLALAGLSNAERGFTKDKNKIEGGQKLSSVLDIIGREIVQAGEQINDPRFPVIKVIPDGTKGSRIIIYRGLEESLSLCNDALTADALTTDTTTTTLSLTSTHDEVKLGNSSCIPVPTYEPVDPATTPTTFTTTRTYPLSVQAWENQRTAPDGTNSTGKLPFYLHDGSGRIQLVYLTGITNASNFDTIGLTISSDPTGLTPVDPITNFRSRNTLNLVEKREYLICDNKLRMRINSSIEKDSDVGASGTCTETGDVTIATNIASMNINWTTAATTAATITDTPQANVDFPCAPATIPPTVPPLPLCPVSIGSTETRDWRDLRGVAVEISAPNPDINNVLSPNIVASGRFYPRNILSTNAQ